MEALVEPVGPRGGGVFVRLAREEPCGLTYDILGDGSEVVEYTYDGRVLGLRLHAPDGGSGILIPPKILPRHDDLRARLGALGLRLNDLRPYLETLSLQASSARPGHPHPPARGTASIATRLWERELPTTVVDLHGDGRVMVARAASGQLIRAEFYEIERGVDLTDVPERGDIGPIFRHHGIPVDPRIPGPPDCEVRARPG